MKVLKKYCIIFCMTIIIACGMKCQTVQAGWDSSVVYGKNITTMLLRKGEPTYYCLSYEKKWRRASKVTAISSNKKVAEVKGILDVVSLTVKKAGTTDLTIVVTKNGKKQTYKTRLKVVNFSNPIKSLKIGEKNLTSKVKTWKPCYTVVRKSSKQKSEHVQLKLASGWKIKSFQSYRGDKWVNIKNNKKNTFYDNQNIFLTVENTKTKQEIIYWITYKN